MAAVLLEMRGRGQRPSSSLMEEMLKFIHARIRASDLRRELRADGYDGLLLPALVDAYRGKDFDASGLEAVLAAIEETATEADRAALT